jgi:hypothetical protein
MITRTDSRAAQLLDKYHEIIRELLTIALTLGNALVPMTRDRETSLHSAKVSPRSVVDLCEIFVAKFDHIDICRCVLCSLNILTHKPHGTGASLQLPCGHRLPACSAGMES